MTEPSDQPRSPAVVSAHVADASVTTAIAAPVTSRVRPVCGSLVSGTARAQTSTSAATGTLMRNAHRQPGPSTSQPPTNGPIAPNTPLKPDHAPTARERSSRWKLAWRIARLPGVSSAAPTPCRTRAATSTSMLGAAPHSSEAAANHTVPITKTRRRPYRSPSAPPRRISEASASRYPVSTHCSAPTPASRSSPMCGRATLTTVASSDAIPLAATVATRARRPRPEASTSCSSGGATSSIATERTGGHWPGWPSRSTNRRGDSILLTSQHIADPCRGSSTLSGTPGASPAAVGHTSSRSGIFEAGEVAYPFDARAA